MEQFLKFVLEVVGTAFKTSQTFFSLLIIVYSVLALLFINYPKINRYLFTSLLCIGLLSFGFVLIDSTVITVSSGRYSIQPTKCQKPALFDQFTIEIKRCNRANLNVNFNLLITNTGKEKELFIYANDTRIFDLVGNENHAQKVSLGDREGSSYSSTSIPENIRIKASLDFEEVLLEGDIISLLEIKTAETQVKFHNLILSK